MADKGEFYKPEEKLTTSEALQQFIWNPRTREFCGRTGSNWLKLLVFYIIFYLCLAAFWALMLIIFYQTIDQRVPKWQLDDSRIGTNPGLGFRPRPDEEHVESTLIWFKQSSANEASWKYWPDNLAEFLKPYEADSIDRGAHVINCNQQDVTAPEGKFCFFDIKLIRENCTAAQHFGYKRGDPCVLIKLNRIYNWMPEPFPEAEMGEQRGLKAHERRFPDEVIKNYNPKKIYITCDGENPADRENIGPINYYPENGIDFKYFPFTNQPGYLSPFVFVHFVKPTPGVLINIECKAWAKNIRHDRMDREGSVHFELLIDGF